jgi:hypothetical protein
LRYEKGREGRRGKGREKSDEKQAGEEPLFLSFYVSASISPRQPLAISFFFPLFLKSLRGERKEKGKDIVPSMVVEVYGLQRLKRDTKKMTG